MKISDEAIEAVAKALNPDLFSDDEDSLLHPALRNSGRWQKRHEVRAALEAAAPYLEPAVPQLADDLERLHLAASALADLWHVPIDMFWQTREMHLEILRSSAVPQPVDREALRERIARTLHDMDHMHTWERCDDACGTAAYQRADGVLALLGGSEVKS